MSSLLGTRTEAPNDPKLSDGGGWRSGCVVGERRRQEAASVTAGAVRCSAWLGVSFLLETANESVVFAMMANPEPDNIGAVLHGCGPVVDADTGRPHPPDLLEVE